MMQCFRETLPSMHTTRRSSSRSGRLRNARGRWVDSATNRRDTALRDVARSSTSRGTRSSVCAYRRVDTPTAIASRVCASSGSVAAGHRQRHHLSVSLPDAKSGYRYLAAAERNVARHAPAPPCRPCDLVTSLRAAERVSVVLLIACSTCIPVAMCTGRETPVGRPRSTPGTGNGT